ncbi:MAG: hypothetical protein J5725_07340 [Bacteroidales bacterium]|nr:hypothetical protein [Bacteroidales bacterium]
MNTTRNYFLAIAASLLTGLACTDSAWAQTDTVIRTEATITTEPAMEYDAAADRKSHTLDKRHQISIGYGILSSVQLNTFLPLFGCIDPNLYSLHHERYTYGAIQIGYSYRITKVIGVGMYYVCEPRITKVYNNELACKLNLTTHTLLPTLKINWLNKRVVTMYSKAGIGVSFSQLGIKNYQPERIEITPDNQRVFFAYQLTLIGIEIGNNQYAGFLQWGAGMEGWFCAGFRIRL